MILVAGIDPGKSGAVAFLDANFGVKYLINFNKVDPLVMVGWLKACKAIYVEKVHARPTDGVHNAFEFGRNLGWWEGLICAANREDVMSTVAPKVWQRTMSCKVITDSKTARKNFTKGRAKLLFPEVKITHTNSEALLIAAYGVRMEQLK